MKLQLLCDHCCEVRAEVTLPGPNSPVIRSPMPFAIPAGWTVWSEETSDYSVATDAFCVCPRCTHAVRRFIAGPLAQAAPW